MLLRKDEYEEGRQPRRQEEITEKRNGEIMRVFFILLPPP
jgi:hypothetical protein